MNLPIKKFKLTSLSYFIIYLGLIVFPLAIISICSYFIPSLNNLAFKSYYIYYGGLSLSIAALLILILTNILIKHNFKEEQKLIDNNYILKINLIFLIFHLIITTISLILNYFHTSDYFIFALYLFYPLIYFCLLLFLEKNKLNRKSIFIILLSIYLLWYLIFPVMMFLLENMQAVKNIVLLKSLLYNLLYNFLRYTLLVMPFISLALIKINKETKEKSLVYKFNFSLKKLIVIAIIVLTILISLSIILKRI